ncbi:GNAT family N-acetyltransferase [Lachnoclostridium sp.]|uniref:GNAT family N-acetyltransferase n=1 Tax=Lachnoclostridium sp. TaxID=2028282 RepID=UPI002896380D|nr:GNAT family N-acetyltransferase [Lachnoclostridium sp.]
MLQHRILNEEEICKVYEEHLKNDFPPEERKPLSMVLSLKNQGIYCCYGLYDNEEFVAYAFFAKPETMDYLLLDYLAVCKNHRSKRYGSRFLKLLQKELKEYQGILFEVESGADAKTEKEKLICERRIAFYLRNGLIKTKINAKLFGVNMILLYLEIQGTPSEKKLSEALNHIYDLVFGEETHRREIFCRIVEE